jgi:argininosuccinate lyase
MALLTLVKGLPMTYNRDLQEDKEQLFDSVDTVRATVRIVTAMLLNTSVKKDMCEAAASDSALLATDLADYLVRKGIPFRKAHHAVGAVVALAEKAGKPLNEVTVEEFKSVDANFGEDVRGIFELRKAIAQRDLIGAPALKQVARQLARWEKLLGKG